MLDETSALDFPVIDLSLDRFLLDGYLDKMPIALGLLDSQLRYLRVNGQLAEMNGFDQESHIGRRYSEIIPSLTATLEPIFQKILSTGVGVEKIEVAGETLDRPFERRHWLADYLPVFGKTGKVEGIFCIVKEVTDNIRAQQAIKQSENLLSRVLDSLFTFVCILMPDGTLVDANATPFKAAQLDINDVKGKKCWDCYWWSYAPAVQAQLKNAIRKAAEGEVCRYEVAARMGQDHLVMLDLMLAPLRDDTGAITHIVQSGVDISDQLEGQRALNESEERFRRVVEAISDGIAVVDLRGKIVMVNSSMEQLFGYERKELIGTSIESLIPSRYLNLQSAMLFTEGLVHRQKKYDEKDNLFASHRSGHEFPVTVNLHPIVTNKNLNILVCITDITKLKGDQKRLEKALAEKTSLLYEVHHRVKNNLQVISSLISLQAHAASKEARDVLLESQQRVRAMALIHQLLYENDDFSNVNLKIYLNRLCALLRESMDIERNRIKLIVNTDAEDLSIELERALPCGLLINELITNAIQHAFPDQRAGEIHIGIKALPNNKGVISVADNGVGLPPNIRLGETNTLGFQLVPMLVDQINASLIVQNQTGSHQTGLHFEIALNHLYKVEP